MDSTKHEKILRGMNHGDSYEWGDAVVYCLHGIWVLFEVPLFGGEPVISGTYPFHRFQDLIEEVQSWT